MSWCDPGLEVGCCCLTEHLGKLVKRKMLSRAFRNLELKLTCFNMCVCFDFLLQLLAEFVQLAISLLKFLEPRELRLGNNIVCVIGSGAPVSGGSSRCSVCSVHGTNLLLALIVFSGLAGQPIDMFIFRLAGMRPDPLAVHVVLVEQ